jgi:hypothetical protein
LARIMANKVIVIPEEMWNATEVKMKAEPLRKSLEEILDAIEKLLENENISDRDKIKLLSQLQQRYNRIYENRNRNVEVRIKEQSEMKPDVQELIKYIPEAQRYKAEQILNLMTNSWDARNQLIINDVPIPNSNIIDLVHDAVSPFKSSTAPIGREKFREKLSELNVPNYLLPKRSRLQSLTVTPKRKKSSKVESAPIMTRHQTLKWLEKH